MKEGEMKEKKERKNANKMQSGGGKKGQTWRVPLWHRARAEPAPRPCLPSPQGSAVRRAGTLSLLNAGARPLLTVSLCVRVFIAPSLRGPFYNACHCWEWTGGGGGGGGGLLVCRRCITTYKTCTQKKQESTHQQTRNAQENGFTRNTAQQANWIQGCLHDGKYEPPPWVYNRNCIGLHIKKNSTVKSTFLLLSTAACTVENQLYPVHPIIAG